MNKITPIQTAIERISLEEQPLYTGDIVLYLQSLLHAEEEMMKDVWEAGATYQATLESGFSNQAIDFNQFISQYNKK